jgi:hypothetical protein
MNRNLARVIGRIPYRIALAGGWIDQPFVSGRNPDPSGSMVVASVLPEFRFMDRAGMATGTRMIALRTWGERLPDRPPAELVRDLYRLENEGRAEPSGSQDMIGLIHPGIHRLDYDIRHEGGYFPRHIETTRDAAVAEWLGGVLHVLPVCPRPDGYRPLGRRNLDPEWIRRLGRSGGACFEAILRRDLHALGASMNDCMTCWEAILPDVVDHPSLTVDLRRLLGAYQSAYPGAMFSGCGGGYLFIVSDAPVPGAFQLRIRTGGESGAE